MSIFTTKTKRPGQQNGGFFRVFYGMALLVVIASVGTSQPPVVITNEQVSEPAQRRAEQGVQRLGGSEFGPENALPPANYVPPAKKAGPEAHVGAAGEVIGFSHVDASGSQTITLVHTGKSWIAVYHIDRSGTVRLVSSRPIDADFSLQLNATSPLPDEIREMAGKR